MRFFMFTLCFWFISFPSWGQGIGSPADVMTVRQGVWESGIRVELHRPCRPVGCAAHWLASKIRALQKTEELFKGLLGEFAVK